MKPGAFIGDKLEVEVTPIGAAEHQIKVYHWNGVDWVYVGTRTEPFDEIDGAA